MTERPASLESRSCAEVKPEQQQHACSRSIRQEAGGETALPPVEQAEAVSATQSTPTIARVAIQGTCRWSPRGGISINVSTVWSGRNPTFLTLRPPQEWVKAGRLGDRPDPGRSPLRSKA
ncbi:hypothetical protein AB1L88_08980 [Tautonia sp. JC769]|uniref:hypothetical protein n=1 Tax=Tautonia sp. JC769 TaxID=3232135 RepID=UPI00345955A2